MALVGVMMLGASFFMPWLTVSVSVFGLPVAASYNMLDLYKTALSSSGENAERLSGWEQYLGLNRVLVNTFLAAMGLTLASYAVGLAIAILSLARRRPAYILVSATLAGASFLSCAYGVNSILQALPITVASIVSVKVDTGTWTALLSGFILTCSYLSTMTWKRKTVEDEPPKARGSIHAAFTMVRCRKCGTLLPKENRFCTECGTEVTKSTS